MTARRKTGRPRGYQTKPTNLRLTRSGRDVLLGLLQMTARLRADNAGLIYENAGLRNQLADLKRPKPVVTMADHTTATTHTTAKRTRKAKPVATVTQEGGD